MWLTGRILFIHGSANRQLNARLSVVIDAVHSKFRRI